MPVLVAKDAALLWIWLNSSDGGVAAELDGNSSSVHQLLLLHIFVHMHADYRVVVGRRCMTRLQGLVGILGPLLPTLSLVCVGQKKASHTRWLGSNVSRRGNKQRTTVCAPYLRSELGACVATAQSSIAWLPGKPFPPD